MLNTNLTFKSTPKLTFKMTDTDDLMKQGKQRFIQGDYPAAIVAYSQARAVDSSLPTQYESYKKTGLINKKTENWSDAAQDLGRAISITNRCPSEFSDLPHQREKGKLYRDLANVRTSMGKDTLAQRTYMQSIGTLRGVVQQTQTESDLDRMAEVIAFGLGTLHKKNGNVQEARNSIGTANLINTHFKNYGMDKVNEDLAARLGI